MRPAMHHLALIVSSVLTGAVCTSELPASITVCSRSDANIGQCLKKATEQALQAFRNGDKQLSINPLEPLRVNELNFIQSKPSKNFQMHMAFKDLDIKGMSGAKVDPFKVTENADGSMEMRFFLNFPDLLFDGIYEIVGKMLLINLKAKDKCHLQFGDTGANVTLLLKPRDVKGVKYLNLDSVKYSGFLPKTAKVHYENLVKGNAKLNADMNKVFEDSIPALHDIFKPSIDSSFGEILFQTANKIFSTIPMHKLLSP